MPKAPYYVVRDEAFVREVRGRKVKKLLRVYVPKWGFGEAVAEVVRYRSPDTCKKLVRRDYLMLRNCL